jgi:hypothetical protein
VKTLDCALSLDRPTPPHKCADPPDGQRAAFGTFARELTGLYYPTVFDFACFKASSALPYTKFYKNVFISAILPNSKDFVCTCQVKTEQHSGCVPRHARHKWSAGLKETVNFYEFPAATSHGGAPVLSLPAAALENY